MVEGILDNNKRDFIENEIQEEEKRINEIIIDENSNRSRINQLIRDIEELSRLTKTDIMDISPLEEQLDEFNLETDIIAGQLNPKLNNLPKLSTNDYIIAGVAGAVAVAIDFLLVGTPEVVKIWDKGYKGERFNGSVLTELIRKIDPKADNPVGVFLRWLSDKCKVPYDVSAYKDTVTPNNHRLRGISHDPFLGLFFAVVDMILGTTTTIDNNGSIKVLPNYTPDPKEQFLTLFYYLGHIISDMFTARGIPIPGFFLTQFFVTGEEDKSIAKIAEGMYLDGYDLRHLFSMKTSVAVKDLIIEVYYRLTKDVITDSDSIMRKEIVESENKLRKEKMLLISDAIGTTGNIVKIFAPPVCGNPNAINVAQWFSLIRRGLGMLLSEKDKTAKELYYNREAINQKWEELLNFDYSGTK